jgi:hypothetical protein
MSKSNLKLYFCDFWPDFQVDNNYFYHLLSTKYNVTIDEKDPDLLFFSVDYGKTNNRAKYTNHRCKKIFYTGESVPANFNSDDSIEISNFQANYSIGKADFAFTFDFSDDPRQYRLPLWALHIDWFGKKNYGNPSYLLPLDKINDNEFINTPKSKFCAFVFSNPIPMRVEIFNKLSAYKPVHGYGKPFNNWSDGELNKYNVISNYKFSICFENKSYPGYYTEKPFHAKTGGTIPIYFSDNKISKDMNENAFINYNDFENMDNLVDYIKMVDQDESLYKQYMSQKLFKGGKVGREFLPESVLDFFDLTILK